MSRRLLRSLMQVDYVYTEYDEEVLLSVEQFMEEENGYVEFEDEYYEEDEDGGDYEEEEEDEDDEEEDDDGVAYIPPVTSPRVSLSIPPIVSQEVNQGPDNFVEENEESQRKGGGGVSLSNGKIGSQENETGEDWNRSDFDGLFCPICMEAWTSGGDHQICCLPCGHIFGLSCIAKWIRQSRSSSKCPQCKRKCTVKDIRVLYASRLVAVDEELQKKVRTLEAKCTSLGKKTAEFGKKEVEWRKREADLQLQLQELKRRSNYLEGLVGDEQRRFSSSFPSGVCGGQTIGNNLSTICGRGISSGFALQKEFRVEGARCFDVDASRQILIIAQRLTGMGGNHVLTKMCLGAPNERENIHIPANTKAVKDLHVSPDRGLVLLASLGKNLSVISMESNNAVISYDLPAPAWSCSWDINNSHYLYAGLQDGNLVAFDMRQTRCPLESISGLTRNPIHTVHSLSPDPACRSGVTSLLTASSLGLCEWNFGDTEKRPFLVPESENQGVCISLACCPSTSNVVASFRPKVEMSCSQQLLPNLSQQSLTPSTSLIGHGVQGCHVLYQRLGSRHYRKLGSSSAIVDGARMAKSTIIYRENHNPLFASSGNEARQELVLQELPSLASFQFLKSYRHPIWDLKYTRCENSGFLGCLTTDALQLYS